MFTLLSGGCNGRHTQDFLMLRPNGLPCYLLLIVKSPARFIIDKQEFTIGSNHAILIRPGIPYQYGSLSGDYVNDWLHFECDEEHAHTLIQTSDQLFHQPIPLSNVLHFSTYLQQMLWEKNYGDEAYRMQNIDMLMQILINNLQQAIRKKDSPSPYSPYASRLQSLRLNMQAQPYKNSTPQELADYVGVSPSYFQHLYKEFFGLPFKTDLINMRIDYAQELLIGTSLKIEEIARMCGYNSEIHFYRQFRKKTGITPKEFQKRQRHLK